MASYDAGPDVDEDTVLAAWAVYLRRDDPILLVRNADRARKLLMQAAGVANGELVGIPANRRRAHSEAVKRSGGTPHFIDLLPDLSFDPNTPGYDGVRIAWSTPLAGEPPFPVPGKILFVDYAESLPAPADPAIEDSGAATIWGLHLGSSDGPSGDGVLIAFRDRALYDAAKLLMTPDDTPDLGRALAQCARLSGPDGIAARLQYVLDEVRLGMEAGAGLRMAPSGRLSALPRGLAVQVPEQADIATFISYVRNENVRLDWLPEIQPMFYVAYQVTKDRQRTFQSAANLARWVVSPLGPDFDHDQIVHAVLGILKGAEYAGVRWFTDPERAAWYGNLMLEWYGPTHDTYRPAFLAQTEEGEYLETVIP